MIFSDDEIFEAAADIDTATTEDKSAAVKEVVAEIMRILEDRGVSQFGKGDDGLVVLDRGPWLAELHAVADLLVGVYATSGEYLKALVAHSLGSNPRGEQSRLATKRPGD